jgi:nucleoside diphosphate kinase
VRRRFGRFKTLAMIKPNTAHVYYEAIKSIIIAHGFDIATEVHTHLTPGRAAEFYAEHEGKPFYEKLVSQGAARGMYMGVYVYVMRDEGPGVTVPYRCGTCRATPSSP